MTVPRLALVTGATGFVGRALVPFLARSGWQVRATGRDAARRPPECEFVAADLTGDVDWSSLVRGVHAVVHLAARVHVMKERARDPLAEFRRANVTVTERLAEAALRAGVRQFVYASSIKVNGEATASAPYTEADEPRPEDAYGRSKLEAEEALGALAPGLAVTLFRLPLVYGPGVKGNFGRLMGLVRRGMPLPLGAIDNRRSLLFVGNLCSAVSAALERPAHGKRLFLLSDGEDISTPELVRRMARAMGRRVMLPRVPVPLLRLAARATGLEAEFRRLADSLQVDISAVRRELDWSPPYSLDEGLATTVEAQAG